MNDRRLPEPRIRDEFRRELRARVMREAYVALAPRPREKAWRAWLRPALALGLAALVLVVGAGSAAAGSLPGDAAFGLKRAMEEVRVALTFDDVERVRVLAQLTDARLSELAQIAERSDRAPTASEEYARAVMRFRAAVDALQEAAPEDRRDLAQDVADAARDKHEAVLEQLRDRLSEKAKPAVERAIEEERRDTRRTREKKEQRNEEDREGVEPATGRPAQLAATPRPVRTVSPAPAQRPATTRPPEGRPVETPGND